MGLARESYTSNLVVLRKLARERGFNNIVHKVCKICLLLMQPDADPT